jgi:hypothetical protein
VLGLRMPPESLALLPRAVCLLDCGDELLVRVGPAEPALPGMT